MNNENIIHERDKFIEIMEGLSGSIKQAFLRVSTRKNAGFLDSDLINMGFSDKPITIALKDNGNLGIFDSGESVYVIEMQAFDYADIEGMHEESTFGFLRTPCKAISIWLQNNKFIVFYFWTDEKGE